MYMYVYSNPENITIIWEGKVTCRLHRIKPQEYNKKLILDDRGHRSISGYCSGSPWNRFIWCHSMTTTCVKFRNIVCSDLSLSLAAMCGSLERVFRKLLRLSALILSRTELTNSLSLSQVSPEAVVIVPSVK